MPDPEKEIDPLYIRRGSKENVIANSPLVPTQEADEKDAPQCQTKEFQDSTRTSSVLTLHNNTSPTEETYAIDDYRKADIEAAQKTHTRSFPPEGTDVVDWDGPNDPENPMNWSPRLRWSHIMLVSAVNFLTGLASSMFAPGVPALMKEFHSTNASLGSFVVTIYVLGLAMGPILFAPLSEIYGRLYVQHAGLVGFFIFTIACGLASSLNMLIGFRFVQGVFGSVPLTNAGAIIADMVKQEVRGFAMSMFTFGVLLGPVIGPVSGGFLAAAKGWRWVFWIVAMAVNHPFLCRYTQLTPFRREW